MFVGRTWQLGEWMPKSACPPVPQTPPPPVKSLGASCQSSGPSQARAGSEMRQRKRSLRMSVRASVTVGGSHRPVEPGLHGGVAGVTAAEDLDAVVREAA